MEPLFLLIFQWNTDSYGVHKGIQPYPPTETILKSFYLSLQYDKLKKLQALRARLQAAEDSPAIEDFDGEQFIARRHKNHTP